MANNYCLSSTMYPLTENERELAEKIIEEVGRENAADFEGIKKDDIAYNDIEPCIEFAYEFESEGLWIYFEESVNPEMMADVISRLQVKLKRDKPFVFSYCCECSKPRLDEFGGGTFCIMPDGSQYHAGTAEDALEKANNPFTSEEKNVIFEAARIALADADNFDVLVEQMDISDTEMSKILEKLQKFMNKN